MTLACGRRVPLRMTKGGAMISSDPATEPIVPLGRLVKSLGCKVGWSLEGGVVVHPSRGAIPTSEKGGCPHVPRSLALELIDELNNQFLQDNLGEAEVKVIEKETDEEEEWLRKFVNAHPVLASLPAHVKEKLVVRPGVISDFPGANKRLRKKGVTLHLYSGKDEGFTLRRAQRLPDPRDRDPKEGRKKTRQIGRLEFSVWRFRWPPRRQKKPEGCHRVCP